MVFNKVNTIMIASTIAVIALIIIQIQWMRQSHDLIEEAFNHRVKMALCSAVENLDDNTTIEVNASCANISGVTANNIDRLDASINQSLSFYNVNLPYELELSQKDVKPSMMSCSVTPFVSAENDFGEQISIDFKDKEKYILGKMMFMLIASIVILLFIVAVLLWANRTLIHQKRISQINIDFFNNMAHEFRTPLASTRLATSLLVKKEKSLGQNKYVSIIKRENEQLLKQVERFLNLAKMEGNNYELQTEPIELDALLTSTIQDMEMQIKEKNAQVNIIKNGADWRIKGDRFHLGNVFRNLLDNALKYSEQDPQVNIQLTQQEKGVQVVFEDNGIGISKCNHHLVFDKFQRIKTGNPNEQKGFGLGLAYVKMIMERHKGMVNIASELKQGSRFDLFLPTSSKG